MSLARKSHFLDDFFTVLSHFLDEVFSNLSHFLDEVLAIGITAPKCNGTLSQKQPFSYPLATVADDGGVGFVVI